MRRIGKWLAVIVGGVVLLSIGAALGDREGGGTRTATAVTEQSRGDRAAERSRTDSDGDGIFDTYDQEPSTAKPVEDPAPEPDPNGDYSLSCDYVLGDFGDSGDPAKGFRFIAGGDLTNTGNVGINVRVTFKWDQLGSEPITERKTYRLRHGQTRDINVSLAATGDQIDLHQSADGDCKTRVSIVGTFGGVQE